MTRRLGVLVALCALAGTASADKAKPKAPTADAKKKAPAPAADDTQPADGSATDDGSAADGSAGEEDIPPHITGPQLVDLGNNTEVDVPAGMILLERVEAAKIVERQGGSAEGLAAVVFSEDGTWWVRIDYDDAGYVTDSDANELDANDLLKSFQEGTAQQNERRKSLGLPEMFLDGWTAMPKYESATHHLVWGLKGHSTRGVSVNDFTRILGRNGFLSVDLITNPDRFDAAKAAAAPLFAGIRFKKGFTYEDHTSSDKSSGMGLKALIVGGAGIAVFKVAKAGILVKFLAVAWKGIVVVFAGIAAFFKRLFGRGKKVELPPDGPPPGNPNVG